MRYLALSLVLAAQLWAQDGKELCSVTLRVVEYSGQPAPYRVETFQDSKGQDYASHFVGLRGQVPCDFMPYTLIVARTDVRSRYGNIGSRLTARYRETRLTLVTNPNLFFSGDRAGEVNRSVPEDHVWNGSVTPVPLERLWIHIRSAVQSNMVVEAEVDADGKFRIYEGIPEGPSILHVMDNGGRVLNVTLLNITTWTPKEPIVIDLSAVIPSPKIVR